MSAAAADTPVRNPVEDDKSRKERDERALVAEVGSLFRPRSLRMSCHIAGASRAAGRS